MIPQDLDATGPGRQGTTYVGARLRRKEDPRLLAHPRYVADLALPGMLHACVLRSPHAHARIAAIDLEPVRRLPGVAGAWCWQDLPRPLPTMRLRFGTKPHFPPYLQPVLAPGEVRFAGEPVALVVARSRAEAEDACEAARVDYEPLPVVTDASAAGPEQVLDRFSLGCGEDGLDAAFAAADVVLRASFRTGRHAGVPMETRGLLADWDAGRGELTLWGATKIVHFNRTTLAGLLGLPEARLRLVEVDVGGGFGVRGEFYPEDYLVPFAALRLGRPVKWVEDRREHLAAANHSRQQAHEVELAARADGTILALRDRFDCDMGAYLRPNGMVVPEATAEVLPGPYHIPSYRSEARCVLTNKAPIGTYRGPGRFEACFVRERLMDLLAVRLGLDAVEVRRRNLIPPEWLPYDRGFHTLDSGDYPALLARALERFGYEEARREQAAARREGRRLGIGMGCFVEKTARGPWESARVEVDPSGEVFVYSGGASVGQGMETVLAQICADALDVAYDRVTVRHGDTSVVPYGTGSWSSRQTVLGGNAVVRAAEHVSRLAAAAAADLLECRPEDVELADGSARVRGTGRAVPLGELARRCRPPAGEGLAATAVFETEAIPYSFGVNLALVEVDAETGACEILRSVVGYDVGRAVNPTLVEGQLVGGCAQGIGGTFLEELVYDEAGQLQSGSLMDYLLPAATDVPRVGVELGEVPTPLNPLGLKGAGEGGLIGVPGCLANAVADALGRPVGELPLTPERVWSE